MAGIQVADSGPPRPRSGRPGAIQPGTALPGLSGNKSQSTNSISRPVVGGIGQCGGPIKAASPATSIFRSSNRRRSAERSSGWASAKYTRVILLMVHQTLPGRIHRLGSVCLRHLGEVGMGDVARCGPEWYRLFYGLPASTAVYACVRSWRRVWVSLRWLVCLGFWLGFHGNKLLIKSNYPPVE